jgi:hypothetical protein
LNDLIDQISQQLNTAPNIMETVSNPNDTSFTNADVTLLGELTKSVPKTELAAGVKETIRWSSRSDIKPNLTAWINSTN